MCGHSGSQIHTVVQSDPLQLGAVKLDIGVWAHRDQEIVPPGVGSDVLVVYYPEEDRWVWICVVKSVEIVGIDEDEDMEDTDDIEDIDDIDW